jgi:hypothetical protein
VTTGTGDALLIDSDIESVSHTHFPSFNAQLFPQSRQLVRPVHKVQFRPHSFVNHSVYLYILSHQGSSR